MLLTEMSFIVSGILHNWKFKCFHFFFLASFHLQRQLKIYTKYSLIETHLSLKYIFLFLHCLLSFCCHSLPLPLIKLSGPMLKIFQSKTFVVIKSIKVCYFSIDSAHSSHLSLSRKNAWNFLCKLLMTCYLICKFERFPTKISILIGSHSKYFSYFFLCLLIFAIVYCKTPFWYSYVFWLASFHLVI